MLGELAPVPSIDGKQFNQMLTLNLLANQALITNFDAMLRRSARARVIAVTSSVGAKPRAYWGAYGASKAALETLVLAYGDEVRADLRDPRRDRRSRRHRHADARGGLSGRGSGDAQARPAWWARRSPGWWSDDFETGCQAAGDAIG